MSPRPVGPKLLLTAICACVLAGILVAGLWPFHAPRNEVTWLGEGDGLRFGKYGSIVSAGILTSKRPPADKSCSIEIWLEPRRVQSSGTILAFYWPVERVVLFALRQSLGDLKLEHVSQDHSSKKAKLYVDDIFGQLKPFFFTISSSDSGTAIYVDGVLVKKSASFKVSSQDIRGQVVVGNSPTTTDSWSGQVKGLAVYDRELTASEVSQHFADWTASRTPSGHPEDGSDGTIARYLFNEGTGKVVRNQVDTATDLLIPDRFFVLDEPFLERPWAEFRSDWNYWKDIAINIGGFIPLGFFFCGYLSRIAKIKRATWVTIVLGFTVSLTIEVLQAFLPTRDSGMTDLMTNTFGTGLGALLCTWSLKHNWFAPIGLSLP